MPRPAFNLPPGQVTAQALALGVGAAPDATGRPTMGRKGVHLLSNVPLFAGLSRRHLRRIADLAEEMRFGQGRIIVQSGAPGKAFYIIAEGRAKVVRSVTGSGRAIARLGPGDFFGEMALLDGGPRSASVVAEIPLTAIRLPRGPFRRLLQSEPAVALKIMEALASRIRKGLRPATD